MQFYLREVSSIWNAPYISSVISLLLLCEHEVTLYSKVGISGQRNYHPLDHRAPLVYNNYFFPTFVLT